MKLSTLTQSVAIAVFASLLFGSVLASAAPPGPNPDSLISRDAVSNDTSTTNDTAVEAFTCAPIKQYVATYKWQRCLFWTANILANPMQ